MKKRLLCTLCLLAAFTVGTFAAIADGKYYIKNVATQKYLAAGHSWGTRSIANNVGLDFTVTAAEGGYTLDSQVSNGGASHFLGDNLYVDAAAHPWVITEAEGYVTIKNGNGFLYVDANDEIQQTAEESEATQWVMISAADRFASLATATQANPVDATFLIQDANFNRNDQRQSAWGMTANNKNLSGGNNENNCAESYHSVFTLSQKLANAPYGIYELKAQGFYRQDGSDVENLPVIYANGETSVFPEKTGAENSMSDASVSFTNGLYPIAPVKVLVTKEGALTIGAKLENNANLWCIWDNFQLTYYGTDGIDPAEVQALLYVERQKLIEAIPTVSHAILQDETAAILNATADPAHMTNAEILNSVADIQDLLDRLEANKAASDMIGKMYGFATSTNLYTESAYDEYIGKYLELMATGKLTTNDLNKLQDPYAITGWHADITVDDLLLSAWDTKAGDWAPYYINTWSVEGEADGSNFKVPFFEYWVADAESLAARSLTATMENQPAGKYEVSAWVRVRAKNGFEAPVKGINLEVINGEPVDVTTGAQVGTSQFYLAKFTATGFVGEDGKLVIKFNVAEDNNISWLSFKDVTFKKVADLAPEAEIAAVPEGWESVITNANLAGDDASSFTAKEAPLGGEIKAANIKYGVGKDETRGIIVKSGDKVSQAWDSQFWLVANKPLVDGTKVHVEFCYKADKPAKASTQAHAEAGSYLHWAAIGDVNFTEEWQHFTSDFTVSGSMVNMQSIAFNLNEFAEANNYYFDNVVFNIQEPAPVEEWAELITNGDLEGEGVTNFFSKEAPSTEIVAATITEGAGVDGGKGIKVTSAAGAAQDWDSQFWIVLPQALPAGTKYKVSFDYKADKAASADTQAHAEAGNYIHYAMIGSPSFTTEWQKYEFSGSISEQQSTAEKTMQSIAFNLSKDKENEVTFFFDNFSFQIEASAVAPAQTPTGIDQLKSVANDDAIYNLNGQKVQKAQKGLYIKNGKKVFVK